MAVWTVFCALKIVVISEAAPLSSVSLPQNSMASKSALFGVRKDTSISPAPPIA